MTSAAESRLRTYAEILALPEGTKAELIDGELFVPSGATGSHVRAVSTLGSMLVTRFGLRAGPSGEGPGGWWVFFEPEVHLALDRQVVMPDIAGWRRERMPRPPTDQHKFLIVPDWVCEVLSPSTLRWDMLNKMPRYREHGVRWVWLVDPAARRIECLEASDEHPERNNGWVSRGVVEGGPLRLPPFDEVELDLDPVWAE